MKLCLLLSLYGAVLTLTWATEEGRSAVVVLEFWRDDGGMWSWEAAEARLEMAPVSMEKYILVSRSQKTMRVRQATCKEKGQKEVFFGAFAHLRICALKVGKGFRSLH